MPLLRALAALPRHDWPERLDGALGARTQSLPADVRSWLAHDVLSDAKALDRLLEDRVVDGLSDDPRPEPPWWFQLESLDSRRTALRHVAALNLGASTACLPVARVDEIATRLVSALADSHPDVREVAAHALAAVAHRFIEDPLRRRRLLERVAARFGHAEIGVRDAAREVFSRAARGSPQVRRDVLDIALAAVLDGSGRVRSTALLVLDRVSLPPGSAMDAVAAATLRALDDRESFVRLPAICTLRDRTPSIEDGELFDRAVRSNFPRLRDVDTTCRRYAANALWSVARNERKGRLAGALRDEAMDAVRAALESEKDAAVIAELRHALKAPAQRD